MTPVALGLQVANEDFVLKPQADSRDSPADLAGDKVLAAGRALVIEQNTV